MEPSEEKELAKLVSNLRKIQERLENVSGMEYQNMEGAADPEFTIYEVLASGTATAAEVIKTTLDEVESLFLLK